MGQLIKKQKTKIELLSQIKEKTGYEVRKWLSKEDVMKLCEKHKILTTRKEKEKVIEKERQDLEVQAEHLATKRIARGMLEGFDCHQQSFRAADRLLSVRVFEICRLGDEIFLRTQIKNRARALFTPESLTVFIDGKALPTAVFPEGGEFHQIKLPFDARLNVIASARGELVKQAQSFSLELAEIGGKNRTVRLDGVSF